MLKSLEVQIKTVFGLTLCFEMVVIDIIFYFCGVFNFLSAKKVYTFQVFTPEFCQEFIEEINNFESTDFPKGRPNTMNNYGVRLYEQIPNTKPK